MSSRKVLICGSGTGAFLATIRSLGRAGLQVHVAMFEARSLALSSKYIYAAHELPPFSSERQWLDAVRELLTRESFRLVIPCHDQNILPIAKYRQELEVLAPIAVPSDDALRVCMDKYETWKLARELQIPVPAQTVVKDFEELENVAGNFPFPLVFKPLSSYTLENLERKLEVKKVWTRESLRSEVELYLRDREALIVQKNVLGVGIGVNILAHSGKVLFAMQHERVHEPLEGGAGSYRRTVPLRPEFLEATEAFMSRLNYTGVAMVEFKSDAKTGKWYLIEINSSWGSLPLSLAAGADFPYWLYQVLVEGRREFSLNYRTNLYCRNVVDELYWFRPNLKADKSNAALHTVPLPKLLGEISNIVTLRERWDTLTLDDPAPAIQEMRQVGSKLTAKVTRSLREGWLRLRRAAIGPRLRKKFKEASSVTFVCAGNICRSPFAEQFAILNRVDSKKVFRSAGVLIKPERQPPGPAIEAARLMGVDLTKHRSQVLTAELVDSSELVVLFDYENYREFRSRFPQSRHKTLYLGVLAREGPIFIKDPHLCSVQTMTATYEAIVNVLGALKATNESQPRFSPRDQPPEPYRNPAKE